jgi:ribbon-helix-helix CopG family protein
MRTTLTIDDDVAAQLEGLRRKGDASLKDIINEALRRGLRDMAAPAKPRTPFRTKSVDAGEMLLPDIDNVAEVLALVEGDAYK